MNKSILIIPMLMTAAYIYLLSGLPIKHYNVFFNNKQAVILTKPSVDFKVGECASMFLFNKSIESWERDYYTLDGIYKITGLGKESYKTNRYLGKGKWNKNVSVKFWTLSNDSPNMKTHKIDCDYAELVFNNESKKY